MDRRMRVASGAGIMDPMHKEKGPSVHHHLSAALGGFTRNTDNQSGTVTPKDIDSTATDDDMKMELDTPEPPSSLLHSGKPLEMEG